MPQLKPEAMPVIGMSLFTQLCSLARVVNASLDIPLTEEQVSCAATNSCYQIYMSHRGLMYAREVALSDIYVTSSGKKHVVR